MSAPQTKFGCCCFCCYEESLAARNLKSKRCASVHFPISLTIVPQEDMVSHGKFGSSIKTKAWFYRDYEQIYNFVMHK